MTNTPSFIAVDLFCGAGGTTNGIIQAGGHVIAGVDNEGVYKETFVRNNKNPDGSNPEYLKRDIFKKTESYPMGEQDILIEELSNLINAARELYPDSPLLFSICAPCQPFTNMSRIISDEREEGRDRDRGLLLQSADIVKHFDPDLILCENVAGIQKKKFGGVWHAFISELSTDYLIGSAIVDAVNYGVPQHRKRSILMAVKKTKASAAAHASLNPSGRLTVPLEDDGIAKVTVKEAIGHFPELHAGQADPLIPNHQCGKVSPMNEKRLSFIKPGGSNRDYIGTGLELSCHVRIKENGALNGYPSGFSDSYTRLSPDRPSPTITTKFYSFTNGRYGHYDTEQIRALSVREAAAIQSFPDDYHFECGSLIKAARMVGNAVPPKLSAFFARKLSEFYSPLGFTS